MRFEDQLRRLAQDCTKAQRFLSFIADDIGVAEFDAGLDDEADDPLESPIETARGESPAMRLDRLAGGQRRGL